jgi:endo-1,4-beta-xylanase
MRVRGHTLLFHNQLASWLTSGTWTKDEAKTLLVDHVTKVVAHYRGRVAEWDVVNEVLGDNGALRSGFWLDKIGPEYIELAFRTARAADPTAGLYYNDYNIEGINAKSDSAYAFVRDLMARGVPITGVGFESHFPSWRRAELSLGKHYSVCGARTEGSHHGARHSVAASVDCGAVADAGAELQDVVSACVSSPACDTVVFWGFTDRESWIPSTFAGWGDALLFDSVYQPKPAFASVQSSLK